MRIILIALLMNLATQVGAEYMTDKDLKNIKHTEVIIHDKAKTLVVLILQKAANTQKKN